MESNSGIKKLRVMDGLLRMQYQLRTRFLRRAISRILVFLLIATCSQSIYKAEAATGDPGSIEFTRNADTFGGEGAKSNWVTYPDKANTELGSSDFTIEFWARYKSFAEQGAIIAKTSALLPYDQTAWMFLIDGSNIPTFKYRIANGTEPATSGKRFGTVSPGTTWHHYAVTRTTNTFRLFFDGVLKESFTETGSIYDNTQPLFLGGWPTNNGSHGFNGFISRLHIAVGPGASLYDSSFTPSLYEITPIATTQLLVASDQGASFLTDSSSNAHIATPGADGGRANVTSSNDVPTGFLNRSAQTISFPDLSSITLGGTAPTLAATASSNLTVAYTSATASVCTVTGTTITVLTAGTCTINANQAGNGAYIAATQVQKSFGVSLRDNTISFPDLSPIILGGTAPTLSATAASNLTVAYTSATSSVCTVSGTTITVLTTGTCTINANQAGNGTYAAATQVQKSFVISPVPVVDDGAAKRAAEQKELTEILALIPQIAELTLSLGETTQSLYKQKCVKGKLVKYVKSGAKCPKGYAVYKKKKVTGS